MYCTPKERMKEKKRNYDRHKKSIYVYVENKTKTKQKKTL